MVKLYSFCLLLLALHSTIASAQSFTTKTGSAVLGKNDVLEVEYIADDVSIDQFRMPAFTNWVVISGPNMSSTNIITGNLLKQQTSYSVILQPKMLGKQVIPGATALINNKPRTSNPVVVEVKNVAHITRANPVQPQANNALADLLAMTDEIPSTQYLKKGENALDKIRNNILIKLEVNKRSCFVGEPILATYKLCTRLKSKSKVAKQPMFTGCTVVELTENEISSQIERINGTEYNVFVIRKVQLIPLNAGALVLPSASVDNTVSFFDASKLNTRDIFGGNPNVPVAEQSVTLQNKPETIEVKELPAFPSASKNEFSGAIGSFDIQLSAGNETLTTTTNNFLTVFVLGVGNLKNVSAPNIEWPKGMEGFEATEKTEEDKSFYPIKVVKSFTYPFVAEKKGTYIILPITFNFLDPATGQYKSTSTQPFRLPIEQGSKHIFKNASLTNVPFVQNPLYLIIGVAILGILIIIFWMNAKRSAQVQPKMSNKIPTPSESIAIFNITEEDYLFKIRALDPVSNGPVFYKELCQHLQGFSKSKFNIELNQLATYSNQHPEKSQSLLKLKELNDRCNMARYTPIFNLEEAMQDRLNAIDILVQLEKD